MTPDFKGVKIRISWRRTAVLAEKKAGPYTSTKIQFSFAVLASLILFQVNKSMRLPLGFWEHQRGEYPIYGDLPQLGLR